MSKALDIIKQAYFNKMEDFPALSYGYLASKMDVSSSLLGKFFKGERSLHPEKLAKLCQLLEIDSETQDIVFNLILKEQGWSKEVLERGVNSFKVQEENIEPETFQAKSSFFLLEKWYYLPCLEATLLKDFDGTSSFLAKTFNLPLEECEEMWQKFIEYKLVEQNEVGIYRKPQKLFRFDNLSKKEALTEYHINQLSQTLKIIESQSKEQINERLITTAIIPCSHKKLAQLKYLIGSFLTSTVGELTDPNTAPDSVYQLSIQALPLSNKSK